MQSKNVTWRRCNLKFHEIFLFASFRLILYSIVVLYYLFQDRKFKILAILYYVTIVQDFQFMFFFLSSSNCISPLVVRKTIHTGWPRNYRKSVLLFCVSVLGRLCDLQYIFTELMDHPVVREKYDFFRFLYTKSKG